MTQTTKELELVKMRIAQRKSLGWSAEEAGKRIRQEVRDARAEKIEAMKWCLIVGAKMLGLQKNPNAAIDEALLAYEIAEERLAEAEKALAENMIPPRFLK